MPRETKTKEVHVYFPPTIFAALKQMAKENRRSMTAEVIIALEEKIARDTKPGPKRNGRR